MVFNSQFNHLCEFVILATFLNKIIPKVNLGYNHTQILLNKVNYEPKKSL